MPGRLYLDHNSTTPLDPRVAEAMLRYAREHTGNPASAHRAGAAARAALEQARQTIAHHLGAHPDEVVFTSGATEANNLAILSSTATSVYVSEIEHPSVLEPAMRAGGVSPLSRDAGRAVAALTKPLRVDAAGLIDPATLPPDSPSALVLVQLANHETGVVQDVATLRQRVPQAHFHCDATQAVGKIPVHFHQLGVSTLACSAHKFHGPPGIGVLLVNRCSRVKPLLFGGHQQNSLRPGTEPVMLAVGMAEALHLAALEMEERRAKCLRLREVFLDTLRDVPHLLNPETGATLPHLLNISFPGCPSDLLFIRLDLAGIDCSTGSACSSGSLLPSPVLQAMGVHDAILRSAIRFSLSHVLHEDAVREAGRRVAREVNHLSAK